MNMIEFENIVANVVRDNNISEYEFFTNEEGHRYLKITEYRPIIFINLTRIYQSEEERRISFVDDIIKTHVYSESGELFLNNVENSYVQLVPVDVNIDTVVPILPMFGLHWRVSISTDTGNYYLPINEDTDIMKIWANGWIKRSYDNITVTKFENTLGVAGKLYLISGPIISELIFQPSAINFILENANIIDKRLVTIIISRNLLILCTSFTIIQSNFFNIIYQLFENTSIYPPLYNDSKPEAIDYNQYDTTALNIEELHIKSHEGEELINLNCIKKTPIKQIKLKQKPAKRRKKRRKRRR